MYCCDGGRGYPGQYLAGAGGTVVVYEGRAVLVHFAVEQTAS